MLPSTVLILAFIGAVLVVGVLWRLASRRHSLPCPVWLRWLVELENPITRASRASVIIARLDLEPGMTVLDAGCGPGRVTIPAAKQVGTNGTVVAVDIQRGMLERARAKAQAAGLANVVYVQAGLGGSSLKRGQIDRALLVTVLGEIPDRGAALREIFRALKPGGILSVTEIIFDPHYQRRRTVARLAAAAGFKEKAAYGNGVAFTLNLEKPGKRES